MRDPWGLNERMFAAYYPLLLAPTELAGQRAIRRNVLAGATGRTLEIGAGNGFNLPHYPDAVTELIVTEPSPHLRRRLRRRPEAARWALAAAGATDLPFADESFDTVVGTYILCTVSDPARALREMHRVLRPAGRYLFMEHIRAGDGTVTGVAQDLLAPIHRYIGAGCHPNRRTEHTLRRAPFVIDRLKHTTMPLAIPTLRPIIVGAAHRR